MRKAPKDEGAPEALDRRGFLRAVGGAGSVAAAVVVSPLAVGEAEASETADEKIKARYQETAHVQAFYRTNRY
ncbi:twin-arginine translocation signal domain-containing protein [Salinarimonas chemoclinalis]|uniref:twin-arginine translocation signal domain-containing protein n=1 Tax=Salinarimonas chemoclinalis TaxID=3241599 RepID=UPI0035588522